MKKDPRSSRPQKVPPQWQAENAGGGPDALRLKPFAGGAVDKQRSTGPGTQAVPRFDVEQDSGGRGARRAKPGR
ncbi:MAG: hypothetical protein AB7E79_16600 [Rhodospirillaceae bacterium]